MKKIIFIISLALFHPAYAQDTNFSKYDFAGMGVSEGEAARMAERANEQNSSSFETNDFSGLGVSSETGARAAETLNEQSDGSQFPMYQAPENQNEGSRLTADDF